MKKTSKILSLLVALCMALTMLSGLSVFAAGELEVAAYEADADFIIVDFAEEVTLTEENIILRKDGVDVPFTVASADHADKEAGMTTYYSYKITPAGGVTIGDEYKLTLLNVENADGTKTLASWAKTFTVANLGDNLEHDTAETILRHRPGTSNARYSTDVTYAADNESITSVHTATQYSTYFGRAVGDDVDSDALHSTPFAPTEGDFTVKVTYQWPNEYTGIQYDMSLGIHAGRGYQYHDTSQKGVSLYAAYNPTHKKAKMVIYSNDGVASSNSAKRSYSGAKVAMDVANGTELKLTVIGQTVRGFVDGGKVIDYTLPEGVTYKGYVGLINAFQAASKVQSGTTTVMSNFQATRSTWNDATPDAPYVAPEEPLNPALIADWDADLDFITLDFTEDIGTLQATLTQAGTQVPVTVSKADHANMEAANAERYTYIIKPTSGGLTRDIPYTLSIANVQGEDDEITTWSKTFKVEVIGEGLTINDANEILNYNTKASYSNVNTDDLQLTYSSSGARAQIYRAVGNDTDSTLLNNYKDSPYTEKDYTVKATFKSLTGATKADFMISTAYNYSDSYGLDHGWFRGVGVRVQVQSKTEEGVTTIGNNANMLMKSSNDTEANGGFTTRTQSAANITGIDTDAGVELKLSTKNRFARAYVNGGKVADMPLAQDYAGMAQIHVTPTGAGATVVVADFIATRAVPVLENVVEFTAGEATVTGSFASGTVSIAATLNNTTASAKNIFAVCALYDASDVMKNIVISPVTSIANTGETELTFNSVAANGATKAKIFIWDSAAALNPWFPAIIAE